MSNETQPTPLPTVVLIHGAFADASSWSAVIRELQAQDITAVAVPNPLRGIAADTEYLGSIIEQIPGPVVLVGHSYGGALITQLGTTASNTVALVYVAAFVPAEGEALLDIIGRFPDVPLGAALRPRPYATAAAVEPGTEFLVDPAAFHNVFCADLSDDVARVMAHSQRPAAVEAFSTPITGVEAWRNRPSWAVVATSDNAIHPDAQRFMAERASAITTEIDASHCVALSQPATVVNVICEAIEATRVETADGWQDPLHA